MLRFTLQSIQSLALWLYANYMRQNIKQREMWAKMFHVLAAGAAVGVGMKYLTDTDAANDVNVIYWLFCAIMFHIFSLIALMGGDEDDSD